MIMNKLFKHSSIVDMMSMRIIILIVTFVLRTKHNHKNDRVGGKQ